SGMLVGMIQGAVLGGMLGGAGVDLGTIRITCAITGFFFGTAVSFFVFRWIIQTQIVPQIARHYAPQVT
ncbi:MAG: hypothetical protein JWR15_922, partial [Prosthecobacter sp.]|nr:hypothetical protein [Prosthecobacter sp.]